MKNELELIIEKDFYTDSVKIWLKGHNHSVNLYYHLQSDGEIIETAVDLGALPKESIKPFIQIPRDFATQFIDLLVQEATRKGISNKQQNIFEGQLIEKNSQIEFLKAQLEKYINKSTR